MAHQGKRMISEDLLAAIEAIKNSGVTAADLIAVAEALKDGDLQGKLTVGDNVTITDENVISATDTTYTAGTNITISDENVISATDTTYTAGTNITISPENVISASGGSDRYTHLIRIYGERLTDKIDLIFKIENNSPTLFTKSTLCQFLSTNLPSLDNSYIIANGYYISIITGSEINGSIEGVAGFDSISTETINIIEFDHTTGIEARRNFTISYSDYTLIDKIL